MANDEFICHGSSLEYEFVRQDLQRHKSPLGILLSPEGDEAQVVGHKLLQNLWNPAKAAMYPQQPVPPAKQRERDVDKMQRMRCSTWTAGSRRADNSSQDQHLAPSGIFQDIAEHPLNV